MGQTVYGDSQIPFPRLASDARVVIIDSEHLAGFLIRVAEEHFRVGSFVRGEFLTLVEKELKRFGLWQPEDDALSRGAASPSVGRANIDFRFSDLCKQQVFTNVRHGVWKLAKPTV